MTKDERSTGPADQTRVYQDAVRIGERIVDFQFQIAIDRLDCTDRLVQLGVATLAGMIAVVGLLFTRGVGVDGIGAGVLGVGFFPAMIAVYWLARLNRGLHREQFLSPGPPMHGLFESISADGLDSLQYFQVLAAHLPIQIDSNAQVIRSLSARQDRALLLLAVGVALHLLAIFYILGRHLIA